MQVQTFFREWKQDSESPVSLITFKETAIKERKRERAILFSDTPVRQVFFTLASVAEEMSIRKPLRVIFLGKHWNRCCFDMKRVKKYPILTSTNWTQVSSKSLQKVFLAQALQNGKPMCKKKLSKFGKPPQKSAGQNNTL